MKLNWHLVILLSLSLQSCSCSKSSSKKTKSSSVTSSSSSSTSSISGSVTSSTANVNLTTVGLRDWVHFGDEVHTRKDGPGESILDYSVRYSPGDYPSSITLNWSDGSPTASGSSTDMFWSYAGVVGHGFTFSVPANSTQRTLTIYANNFGSDGELSARLRNGAGSVYTDTATDPSGTHTYTTFTITYSSQTATYLDVEWIATAAYGFGFVAIQGMALATTGTVSVTDSITGGQSATVSPVDVTAVGTADWIVLTNNEWSRKLTGNNQITFPHCIGCMQYETEDTGPSTSTYSFTDGWPIASLSISDYVEHWGAGTASMSFTAPASNTERTLIIHTMVYDGTGQLTATLSDGSAADVVETGTTPGTFGFHDFAITYTSATPGTIKITFTSTTAQGVGLVAASLIETGNTIAGGSLAGIGSSLTAGTVDLTAEGVTDWVAWQNGRIIHRKATGLSQLSDYKCESCTYGTYLNDPRTMSWTDGDVNAYPSFTNNDGGYMLMEAGSEFILGTAAVTADRTFNVYVGGKDSGATLRAWLSDGSNATYTHTVPPTAGGWSRNYTLTFKSATPGTILYVSWMMNSDLGNGEVRLSGAALSGASGTITPTISIIDAKFGAELTCDATAAVQASCDGQASCTVLANTAICGDPLNGSLKRLTIFYSCAGGEKVMSARENENAELACP